MILWSGLTGGTGTTTDTGASYDPAANVWTTIALGDKTPVGRRNPTAFWTGSEMLVFGGMSNAVEWGDGGRYCGCTAFYQDADADGHGNPSVFADSCNGTVPPGYVSSSDDCDDADPTNFPGNIELCDGRDNDCNGSIEIPGPEGDADHLGDASDPDADGDGILEDGDGSGTAGDAPCAAGQSAVLELGDHARLDVMAVEPLVKRSPQRQGLERQQKRRAIE